MEQRVGKRIMLANIRQQKLQQHFAAFLSSLCGCVVIKKVKLTSIFTAQIIHNSSLTVIAEARVQALHTHHRPKICTQRTKRSPKKQ